MRTSNVATLIFGVCHDMAEMASATSYLYENSKSGELERLRGLEAIEDAATIALLSELELPADACCLEVGAGAGSIAAWLADHAGEDVHVVATDIDTNLLDSSAYEVWRHDIERDELPEDAFDLIHLRHVLIHLPKSSHTKVMEALFRATRCGGVLIAEESDLHSWHVDKATPDALCSTFSAGVDAVFAIYSSRGIDSGLGAGLADIVSDIGFKRIKSSERYRSVRGASPEAAYQEVSVRQLADTARVDNPALVRRLCAFADCFRDRRLQYCTRTTVAVCATKRG